MWDEEDDPYLHLPFYVSQALLKYAVNETCIHYGERSRETTAECRIDLFSFRVRNSSWPITKGVFQSR